MTSSPSEEFEVQLNLFRQEAVGAIQCFYAWHAIHAVAARDRAVYRLLNQAPTFWNTSRGALQTAALVALGRIFDPNQNNHNVSRMLSFAHANSSTVFSKEALAQRKRKLGAANVDEWLPEYLRNAYVPTSDDFRRLKKHVSKRRKIYETRYQPIRHKVVAHRGSTTANEVGALFARTNVRELQQLLVFLLRLHEALWQLTFNGRRPILQPARFSVQRMLEQPSPNAKNGDVQERLIKETKTFLTRHSKDA